MRLNRRGRLMVGIFLPIILNAYDHGPFVEACAKVLPAVVNISAERVVEIPSPFSEMFEDPFFRYFKKYFPEYEWKQRLKSLGSGVIITSDGYVVTNYHVIAHAENIVVSTGEETFKDVEIVGVDSVTDIALLKVKAEHELPYIEWGDSDSLKVGEWVIAIGSPLGPQYARTVTMGIVSAKGRVLPIGHTKYWDLIQTDAAINPGNSGGPLVNIEGKVVGINVAIATGTRYYIGLGFAIPSNTVKRVVEDLMKYHKVQRAWLGVTYQKLDADLAQALGLEKVEGVVIVEVMDGSPADKAGIKPKDVIIEFNGKKVTFANFAVIVAHSPIGEPIKVKLIRNKRVIETEVILEPREKGETKIYGWLGMRVESTEAGVTVIDVSPGSPADEAGIQKGDRIKMIGDIEIKSLEDYERASQEYKDRTTPILFVIERQGKDILIAIKPK